MTNTNEIRLVRAPKLKLFAPAHIVDGFEIKWDTRIQAWEMAKRPKPTGLWEFRIGRVVNGVTFITEMVADTKIAGDRLSVEADRALVKLGNGGVDLGEWVQDIPSVRVDIADAVETPEPAIVQAEAKLAGIKAKQVKGSQKISDSMYAIDELIMELERIKEDWDFLEGKKLRILIERKMKSLRRCIQKSRLERKTNPNRELSTGFLAANPGNCCQEREVYDGSSTSRQEDRIASSVVQIDAIANIEFLGKDSSVQLDTSARHYVLLNMASAMRHVAALPQVRYVAGLDEWGRVLLQEQGNSLPRSGS